MRIDAPSIRGSAGNASARRFRTSWLVFVVSVMLSSLLCEPAHAVVSTFRQDVGGYTATLDTELIEGGDTSQGSNPSISVDADDDGDVLQGLIRFDDVFGPGAGQIPLGSVINSATLTLEAFEVSVAGANVRLHRMLSTWDESSHWDSMGNGVQTNGSEAMVAADSTLTDPTGTGSQTFTGLAAALQSWSDGATNFGWVILNDNDDGWDFRSSEYTTVAERPLLTVDWSPAYDISGVIFEDFVGDALDDGAIGSASNPIEGGVRVELFEDDGDGDPDGGDSYLDFEISDSGDGSYTFTGLANGTYWITVFARGVDEGPYNGAYDGTYTWAEQTYGPVGAARFNGSTWSYAPSAGPFYGGARWDASDNFPITTSIATAEHVARVVINDADVADVDFGFSFNVVTSTRGGSATPDPGAGGSRTVQGSLRQFLINAAAQDRPNTMRFVPTAPTNATDGGGSDWWRIDVSDQLPSITDVDTTVDGRAYDSADGTTIRNSNPAVLGTGGTVGAGPVALGQVNGPELEIRDTGGLDFGLRLEANDATVRRISIWGFGNAGTGHGGFFVANAVIRALIEENVIGSGPAAFADPGVGSRNWENIFSDGADDGTVQNNLIGFGGVRGVLLETGSTGWTISGNEFRDNALDNETGDGIAFSDDSNDATGNLIVGSASQGFVVAGSSSGNTFTNNTLAGNGVGIAAVDAQSAGISIRSGVTSATLDLNVIRANYGAGIQVNDGATGIKISRNSIYDNGTIAARNGDPATGTIGIDLNGSGEDPDLGDFPFFTENDPGDVDTGGNTILNFPVLDTAYIDGANLILTGWVERDAVIELFITDGDPTGFGEGQTYLLTLTESGTGAGGEDPYTDSDATIASGYTDPVNGLDQGEDTTNRFRFVFPKPGSVVVGTELTATARDGSGNTSEFGGRVVVQNAPADLEIAKSDSPDPAPLFGPLVYTLVLTNNGPGTATGVTVTDVLPASTTLQSATPSQGSCIGTTTVTCDLGSIVNTGTASVEIVVTTSAAGDITNNASVSGDQADGVPGNNSDAEITTITADSAITDVPLTQFRRIHGFTDYTVTGGSLRTQPNGGGGACVVGTTSTATLSGIPAGATVTGAYLYWAATGSPVDDEVRFDGTLVTADRTFEGQFSLGANTYDFFGGFEDVTTQVATKGNGDYDFEELDVEDGDPYCASKAVLGGWSLIVIYESLSLSGKTLVLYDGFDIERNGSTDYLLTGIYSADPPEVKTTYLVWEGDDDLGGTSERFLFNSSAQSDGLNPVNNVYNSTINSLGSSTSYGLDLDTFDVSAEVSGGDTLATAGLEVGPDLVILNAVVLQAKSNIIAGRVFEDVNYGGGDGRSYATAAADAPGFTVGRTGAKVELYDSGGNFLRRVTTGPDGEYGFTGLVDGDYQVRVVNETVTSSRPGAAAGQWPVQTFRTDASDGNADPVVDEVGGANPSAQDAGENLAPEENLSAFTAQSVSPVEISTGVAVNGVDFGFNFDTIVNTNDTGQGSLRQFLDNANGLDNTGLAQQGRTADIEHAIFMLADGTARPGMNTGYASQFSGGVATIAPQSVLPFVLDETVLDATTQPGFVDRPIVELNGTDAGAGISGLRIQAGGSTIRGLIINRFNWSGILIDTLGGNTVVGNWLGTDATGAAPAPNNQEGVFINGTAGNVIGGTDSADRNVISGNRLRGILIEPQAATGNRVEGNFIGTDPTGMIAVPNDIGIYLWRAPNNTIGGLDPDAGNLVSGNDIYGIYLVEPETSGNLVQGNTVGLKSDGSGPLGNASGGVVTVSADDNTIGGTDPNAPNTITGGAVGVGLSGGSGNEIRRNVIYGNSGLSIDHDNDGVSPNDGSTGAGANDELDYPIFTAVRLTGSTLSVEGFVGTAASKIPGPHTIEVFKADDDGNNDGEIVSGDGQSAPHGEGRWYVDSCASAADGTIDCTLTVPGGVSLSVGDAITATATDGSRNTSEMSANAQVFSALSIVKRAFQSDGTPIASNSTLPSGVPVKFLLYIDNPSGAVADVSLQDVLDPVFVYQVNSMKVDDTLLSSAVCPGGVCDEAAIFAQVDGSGTALGDGDAVVPPTDGDAGSYAPGTRTIDLGDGNNGNNDQLDLAAGRVWAVVFTVVLQ